MLVSALFPIRAFVWFVLGCCAARASGYLLLSEPKKDTVWKNGNTHPVLWRKGVLDDLYGFDVEMARLGQDGLTLVAMNVIASSGSLNINLQDIPAGDDYFLIFINSTHGVMHKTSPRFTILSASSTQDASSSSPDSSAPTVSISGAPNPTKAFATTFPPVPNSALGRWEGTLGQAWGLGSVMVGCVMGAAWTLW